MFSLLLATALSLSSALEEDFDVYYVNEQKQPLILAPKNEKDIVLINKHQEELQKLVSHHGSILFRNFGVSSADEFSAVVSACLHQDAMNYIGEGSRTKITSKVYTSTEAPEWSHIPLHNELSCTTHPPQYICFYCDVAPTPGSGQTLLGTTEEITQAFLQRPCIWNLFFGRNLKYISRHPTDGNFFSRVNQTHKSWQQSFETTDPADVGRICQEQGFDCEWDDDWITVIRTAPAILGPDEDFNHPYWYNQAHLYDANPRIRGGWVNHILASLLYMNDSTKQYEILFEDGSHIPREVIYEIYDVLDEKTIRFDWQQGDVLLLDNKKMLHGRAPYTGPRRILVTMIP